MRLQCGITKKDAYVNPIPKGFELMLNNPAIGNLIRKNETNKIQSTIQTSRRTGMVTLDDFLLDLVKQGRIEPRTALDFAQSPADLESRL